ncbi:MAG: hypothetical protein VR64_00290 [Desulfatitalea sp. BRH_c12]|nr:MAG: hypothetical protein VR64_00290 [Desulfatitalea sp. BRH_c12]
MSINKQLYPDEDPKKEKSILSAEAVRPPSNKPTQAALSNQNKQADKTLLLSENTASVIHTAIEQIYHNAPVGLCVLDTELRYVRINERLAEMNGRPVERHIGRPIREIVPALAEQAELKMHKAIQTGNPVLGIEMSGETAGMPGITRTWVSNWEPLKRADGTVIGLNVVTHEITRQKQAEAALRESEQKFRVLFENSTHAILLTVPDGKITAANPAACDMFGCSEKEICDLGRSGILDTDDPRLSIELEERERTGYVRSRELTAVRKSGEKFPVEVDSVIISDNPVKSFVIMRDITERKHWEQALHHLNSTLEQQVAERAALAERRAQQLHTLAVELIEAKEQERQRIAQLLHDDMQQILAAARLQLQMAIENLSTEPKLEKVDQLLKESISKARRLSHELSPPVLHHSGLTAALQWLVRQVKTQFGLTVALETAETHIASASLKLFVFRAVKELLFNITKHAGVKNARVVLSCSDRDLVVAVSDQGKGFDTNVLESSAAVFGLGLLSIQELARYIGGNLKIESSREKGSRFILRVPLSMANTTRTVPIEPDTRKSPSPVSKETGIRVLFADDHKVIRQGLIQLIAKQPDIAVVGEAANGREALELARQLRPDVIVMDIAMPEMDGIEATRRIKTERPDVRVIGLSMHDDEQIAQTIRHAGADAFVSKTSSSSELLKEIYRIARQEREAIPSALIGKKAERPTQLLFPWRL